MNILVTGGRGFIGSHIVNLLKEKHTITILDAWSFEYPGYKYIHRGKNGLELINGIETVHRLAAKKYRDSLTKDIKVIKNWTFEDIETENYDLIINCGSLSEAILSQYFEEFTEKSILDGLAKLKNNYNCPILHFSSSMSYGSWSGSIKEEGPREPVDLYGACKKASESLLDLDKDIILRPMHVYGYGDGKFPMPMNIERQASKNQPVNVEEADCIYIKDLIAIIDKIINNWIPGVYNLSSGYQRDKHVIEKYAKEILNFDIETSTKSGPTGKDRGTLDTSKIKTTYNWESNFKNYEETIIDYFNTYMKEQA
jgi:nucleoside-diphosphate-sugar epimerase